MRMEKNHDSFPSIFILQEQKNCAKVCRLTIFEPKLVAGALFAKTPENPSYVNFQFSLRPGTERDYHFIQTQHFIFKLEEFV